MHRTIRAAIATLALLALPQLAAAGPIQWEYSTTIIGENGNHLLDLGIHQWLVVENNGNDISGPFDFHVTQELPLVFPGIIPAEGSVREIQLAGMTNQGGTRINATPEQPADPRFKVSMTIKDLASGETGTVDLFGRVDVLSTNVLNDPKFLIINADEHKIIVLGGNRYDIHAYGGDTESNTRLWADVTVGPVAATPEPGTFMLAALGLGGIALRLRRRFGTA
jgi:hypothetical protein